MGKKGRSIRSKDGNKILVIDAKYYTHNTLNQFNKYSIHSGNLYQVFTYVKNLEANNKDGQKEIAGMLLYAKTVEQIQPDNVYHMSGNKISVRTLDLNQDFVVIASTLNMIADDYFKERTVAGL